MRLVKPLSVLQIFATLIISSSLMIFLTLAVNSYFLGSKAYDEALSQSFEQKAYLTQQMLNSGIEKLDHTLGYWASHKELSTLVRERSERKIRSMLNDQILDSEILSLDLFYISTLTQDLIIDASSPFYLSKLIYKKITQSDEESDSFLFQEEGGPHLILFRRIGIIDPASKELVAYIYGGVVINHWLDFINQIAESTKSSDIVLFVNHIPIISTNGQSLKYAPNIDHRSIHTNKIYKKDQFAYCYTRLKFGATNLVEILFTDDLSHLSYLQKRYLFVGFIWFLLIALLTLITIMVINKLLKTSLSQLIELTQTFQKKSELTTYTPTSIREFNTIGRAIEEMVKTIRQNERVFHTIFDHSAQFMGLLTADGTLVACNKTSLDNQGITIDEVRGKKYWNTPWWKHSPELQLKLRISVDEVRNGTTVQFEATHIDTNGKEISILFSLKPVIDDSGKVVLIIPEGQDITDMKAAEKLLRQHNQELEQEVNQRTQELTQSLTKLKETHRQIEQVTSAVEVSSDGIVIISTQGEIHYYNKAFSNFFEISDNMSKSIFEIFPERSHYQHKMNELLNGTEWVEKLSLHLHSGKNLELLLNANIINSSSDNKKRLIMTFTDLTRLVETEEKLHQSEVEKYIAINSNKAKSSFLANMSHELRTPLHCITSFTGLAHKKLQVNDYAKVNSYLDTVSECTSELTDLIDQLLLLSSLEAGLINYTKRQYSIDILIQEVEKNFAKKLEAKKIKVVYTSNNPTVKANFDSHHILHVFNGLLSNAIKYATPETDIVISVDDYIEKDHHYTIVSFKNKGTQIPQNELGMMFSSFNQNTLSKSNSAGTGLGLSICRKIVEDHDGRIWATSSPEGLTEICLILPKFIEN